MKSLVLKLKRTNKKPPAILTSPTSSNLTTGSTPSNIYQRQIQQEEANSFSDFTISSSNRGNTINNPSGFILSPSNGGNQGLPSKDNLNFTLEV